MLQCCDAIVAGAGPAGATVAICLARAGWDTVLIDASGFPRDKVCGECLSAAALPVLRELGLEQQVRDTAVPARWLRIVSPRGPALEMALAKDAADEVLGISRRTLDWLLLQAAQASGARVLLEHRVRRVLFDGGRVTGVEAAANVPHAARHTLHARVVIAADGRYSTIVRQTGRVVAQGPRLVGFKCHRSGARQPHGSDNAIEMVSFPGGYLGLCQVEDGQQNVCGVMPRAALRRARGSIEAALQTLTCDTTPFAERGGTLTMPDVRQQRASPLAGGVLYVGDALETIEPLAGQGLAMAIAGAHLAAEILLADRRREVDAALQRRYAERCLQRFGPTIGRAQRLGWLLRRPALLSSLAAFAPASACLEELLLRACYRWTRLPPSHLLTR